MAMDYSKAKYDLPDPGDQPKEYETPVDRSGDRPASDWNDIAADEVFRAPADGRYRSVIPND